jgi:Zn-dependent protease
MGLADFTFQSIAFRVLALLIIAAVHGGIVAGTAVLLGDRGPKYDGRLTVAPAGHIDTVGAFSMVLFGLGWTKPVTIDARQFRIGRMGIVVVILAGFVGMLVLAAVLDVLVRPALTTLPYSAGLTTAAFLRVASGLSIWFALFGLIPIPPLTGGLLLDAFGIRVPGQAKWILVAVLLVAAATGVVRQLLGPAHAILAPVILGN